VKIISSWGKQKGSFGQTISFCLRLFFFFPPLDRKNRNETMGDLIETLLRTNAALTTLLASLLLGAQGQIQTLIPNAYLCTLLVRRFLLSLLFSAFAKEREDEVSAVHHYFFPCHFFTYRD
jgi:hypothetical protein